MKMMTRMLSAILVMAMLISTVAFAADFSDVESSKSYYEAVQVLSNLGIINGYEDGTFGPEKDVTRAEFSTMLMRALASSGIGSSDPASTPFKDLGEAAWAVSDIKTAYDLGIINGMTATTFEPNSKVTYEQALKMIVCALNYEAQAESFQSASPNQPWYYGFMQTANSLKLTDGVPVVVGQPAKRWEIAQMIYNALDIKMLEKLEMSGGGAMYQESNQTMLGSKLGIGKSRGEIYADESNTIAPDGATTRVGCALIFDSIDNTVYTIRKGEVSLEGKVGQSVDYYYKLDAFGEKTLEFIITKGGSLNLKIDASNIANVTGTNAGGFTVTYYPDANSIRTAQVKIAPNAVVSVNGVVRANANASTLFIDDGTLELIATDGTYSKVNVTSYETYVVKSVNSTDRYIVDMYRNSTTNTLYLDDQDSNVVLTIKNTDGKTIALSGIGQKNVISVKRGQGQSGRTTIDVIVSQKSVSGTIKEIDAYDGKINIAGTVYSFSKYFDTYGDLDGIQVSDNCRASLDKDGKIAYLERTSSTTTYYGYFSLAAESREGVLQVAVISQKTPTMGSPIISFAEKVRVDGEVYSNNQRILTALQRGGALNNSDGNGNGYSQLVKYTVNSLGLITSVETDAVGDNEDITDESVFKSFNVTPKANGKMTYKSSSYQFTGANSSSFRINSSTQVIVVPEDRRNYEGYSRRTSSYFTDGVDYVVEPYDVTGSLNIANVVVVYSSAVSTNAISSTSSVFIITGISETINADGNECDMVTGYRMPYNSGIKENSTYYTDAPGVISENFAIGDVIMFATNNKGYITEGPNTLKHVFSPSDYWGEFTHVGSEKYNTTTYNCELYSGLLMGSAIDGGNQLFELADADTVAQCATAQTTSMTATSSTIYLTFDSTLPNNQKVTLQSDALDLTSFASYNETKDAETPSAAKVFVYRYANNVKLIYVVK